MSDYEKSVFGPQPPTDTDPLQDVLSEVREEVEGRAGQDPTIRDFWTAAEPALLEDGPYLNLVKQKLVDRPGRSATYYTHHFYKAHQFPFMQDVVRELAGFPDQFRPERWRDVVNDVSEPHNFMHQVIRRAFHDEELMSNVLPRGTPIAIILASEQERLGNAPRIIDVGCSQNLILNALATGHPLREPNIVDKDGHPIDKAAQNIISFLAKLRPSLGESPIGKSAGVEIRPVRTLRAQQWVKNCSLNPQELTSGFRRSQAGLTPEEAYDLLVAVRPPHVSLLKADFADLSDASMSRLKKLRPNLITFSHVLYQQPYQIDRLIDNALELIEPDGLIVAQDFLMVNPKNPRQLSFYPHWYVEPWLCSTVILDPSDLETGWQTVFEGYDGRFSKIRFGKDIGSLALRPLS